MSDDSTRDNRHWRVARFGSKTKPDKYRGTWFWDVGRIVGENIGFPMFHVMKSSHGYRKGTFKKRNGPYSRTGPVIKTRSEAIRQAKAAMAKLDRKDVA